MPLLSSAASAQITVQQPVVQTFSVDTVVVVPDRGSTFLGGVSSGRETSSQFGFSPLGSSIGLERNHSAASASVYIHDFEAMDRALLDAAASSSALDPQLRNPLAERAWQSLMKRHGSLQHAPQVRVADFAAASDVRPSSPVADAASATPGIQSAIDPLPVTTDELGRINASASPVIRREHFGRFGQSASPSPPMSRYDARRSTNSSDSPAASRASR
jgi:hypothetical protein